MKSRGAEERPGGNGVQQKRGRLAKFFVVSSTICGEIFCLFTNVLHLMIFQLLDKEDDIALMVHATMSEAHSTGC